MKEKRRKMGVLQKENGRNIEENLEVKVWYLARSSAW